MSQGIPVDNPGRYGHPQGVWSEAITSPARLTILHLASVQSVPASAGRTTSQASLGPSGASIPRAAWNVTVNVGPSEKARKLSIFPLLAATTAKPFPKARHARNAIETTTMTRSSPQPSNRRRPDPGRASGGGVHPEVPGSGEFTSLTLARAAGANRDEDPEANRTGEGFGRPRKPDEHPSDTQDFECPANSRALDPPRPNDVTSIHSEAASSVEQSPPAAASDTAPRGRPPTTPRTRAPNQQGALAQSSRAANLLSHAMRALNEAAQAGRGR
jgi:hypothetical protein